jgi:Xaa-Pro dipeptidase
MPDDRLGRVRLAMDRLGLHALALIPGPTLYHLTGLTFHLMERPVVALIVADQPPRLILPELELPKVGASRIDLTPMAYGEDETSRREAFAAAAAVLGTGKVGIEPLRMRVHELRLLEAAAPSVTFVPADRVLAPLRLTKDRDELEAIRRAVGVAEAALAATLPLIRIGMTERELASELTLQMLRAGSDTELPFPPIVASGPNSAVPHAVPGDRSLQPRDFLILDWGAAVEGYVSDVTRTFAIGEIDPELGRVHEIVQQANAAGRWAVRPEGTCAQVDQAARAVIEAAGYGERFVHRIGHGIGLEAHEPPYLHKDNGQFLIPGMTFTVEPGIYLPDRGGARIEDNLAVTSEGAECLTGLDRQLEVLG